MNLSAEQELADGVADRERRRRCRSRRAPSTISTSCRMPARKSSSRPSPARRASFGSSAACTAWNSRIGMRAMKRPVMNLPTRSFWLGSASTFAARKLRVRQQLARAREPTSSQPSAVESSEYGASGPGVEQAVLAAQRDGDRDERRQREREAVRARRRRRPTTNEHDAERRGGRCLRSRASGRTGRSGRCPTSVPRVDVARRSRRRCAIEQRDEQQRRRRGTARR